MIIPSNIDTCMFQHEDIVYQFSYDAEDETMSFINAITTEEITDVTLLSALLLKLVKLGEMSLGK